MCVCIYTHMDAHPTPDLPLSVLSSRFFQISNLEIQISRIPTSGVLQIWSCANLEFWSSEVPIWSSRSGELQNSRFAQLQIWRTPDVGILEIWISGLEVWRSGVLEIWIGSLEIWRTGVLEIWRSGVLEFWRSEVTELWSSGFLEF